MSSSRSRLHPPHHHYPSHPSEPRLLLPPPEDRHLAPVIWDPNRIHPRPVAKDIVDRNEPEPVNNPNGVAQAPQANGPNNGNPGVAWTYYSTSGPVIFAVPNPIHAHPRIPMPFHEALQMGMRYGNVAPLPGFYPVEHLEDPSLPSLHLIPFEAEDHSTKQDVYGRIPSFVNVPTGAVSRGQNVDEGEWDEDSKQLHVGMDMDEKSHASGGLEKESK